MSATPVSIDFKSAGADTQANQELPFDANAMHAPNAATAAVVVLTADASRPNILGQIYLGYSAAPTGGSIKVEDGSTTVWGPFPIAAAGTQVIDFNPPLCGTRNTAMTITLASGAGAVVGILAVNAWKRK